MRYCSRYFKTSHVIVYLLTMLLSSFFLRYFKTSHVIVYHFFTIPNTVAFIISKHLMLLFIHIATFRSKGGNIISKHLMLLFIGIGRMLTSRLLHFKTSHVIVYHYAEYEQLVGGVFQNISCYCLSFLAVSV